MIIDRTLLNDCVRCACVISVQSIILIDKLYLQTHNDICLATTTDAAYIKVIYISLYNIKHLLNMHIRWWYLVVGRDWKI